MMRTSSSYTKQVPPPPSIPPSSVTPGEDPVARKRRHFWLDRMPSGVEVCRYFKIMSQDPQTPHQVVRHALDHQAEGIIAGTCPHATTDHRSNRKAYWTRCSTCYKYIEYYSVVVQPEVKMVMEGIRMLAAERQRQTVTDEWRAILKQACATLKNPPPLVAGPRSSAGNGGPMVTGNCWSFKFHGPRQEATPGRDVTEETNTSCVTAQDDGQEDTELPTDDTRAEATNSQATSDVRVCDRCSHGLNGDEQYEQHMEFHRFQERLRWEEDTEITRGAFYVMVALAKDKKPTPRPLRF
jgi:hypothetical protein